MSEYNHKEIESRWQQYWKANSIYKTEIDHSKPKYYVLDMFPYPSGAGLHVGHPLGYIATDILSRYKRHCGFNVLHPMGYDSFGLPAEQYAIQTGQHPAITTEQNINTFRKQLDVLGFSYDWNREVRTSDPAFYKWTQWIFIKLFHSWYNPNTDKAEPIDVLIKNFEVFGFKSSDDTLTGNVEVELNSFTASEWKSMSEAQQQNVLMHFRLAYLSEAWVNWCPALGSVLANDEVKDGVSERGGFPVERKQMKQWSLRITSYSQRLLDGLNSIDWPESVKESQRNWIGRSEGCSLKFEVLSSKFKVQSPKLSDNLALGTLNSELSIEVFTTRPDTVYGVSFITLAPEHELIEQITTDEYRNAVNEYVTYAKNRSERERQADVKKVTGQFTGAYVMHPFTSENIPVWIGEYVLSGYGTGAVMGVPAHDSRDHAFAKHFDLQIIQVIESKEPIDISEEAYEGKEGICINSELINGLEVKAAIKKIISEIEKRSIGKGKTNFRLRDAVFGRQRYWGEPIPVYYVDGIPYTLPENELPLLLPEVDEYKPTATGEPPLARAKNWSYVPLTPHPLPLSGRRGEEQPLYSATTEGEEQPPHSTSTDAEALINPLSNSNFTFAGYRKAETHNWGIKKEFAREQRKNPTAAEEKMWALLRNNQIGFKIRRQHWIGPFLSDFVCLRKRTIIEIDGGIHYQQKEYDEQRTNELNRIGFKVIRFSNDDVLNNALEVKQKIKSYLESQNDFTIEDTPIEEVVFPSSPTGEGSGVRRNSDTSPNEPVTPIEEVVFPPSQTGEGSGVRRIISFPLETTTMPGWAGSSWYYLRYMDAKNTNEFSFREALDYWKEIDFYLGGAEHSTGHLIYFRFWTKFLKDLGFISIEEPAKKLVNQGMIQGRSNFVYRQKNSVRFVSKKFISDYDVAAMNVDVNIVKDDTLDIEAFRNWREEFKYASFILEGEDGQQVFIEPAQDVASVKAKYKCGVEIEKMSKSKYNVVSPEVIVEQYGADCLRMYEMFLGPLEQHKPWNTNGISGVFNFLKKAWRLFENAKDQNFGNESEIKADELKILHRTIKKISEDIERLSFNTSVSAFMICVNELTDLKTTSREILQPLAILLSPFAPHIAEEFYRMLGNSGSITFAAWPVYDERYLTEATKEYPVSINGKVRFKLEIASDATIDVIQKLVMESEQIEKYLNGAQPKKVIVVPGKIVNVVL